MSDLSVVADRPMPRTVSTMTQTPTPRTCTRCNHYAATHGSNMCRNCRQTRFGTWAEATQYGTKDYRPLRADIREMEQDTGTKHCGACKRFRDPSMFGSDKRAKDGLTSWCKACRSERETRRQAKLRAEQKLTTALAETDQLITEQLAVAALEAEMVEETTTIVDEVADVVQTPVNADDILRLAGARQ